MRHLNAYIHAFAAALYFIFGRFVVASSSSSVKLFLSHTPVSFDVNVHRGSTPGPLQ